MKSERDNERWDRISALFDLIVSGGDPAAVLASEPDPGIRSAVEDLWKHHVIASESDFLVPSPEFALLPVFEPGRILVGRFRIENMIGRGGMGEV
jgi:hypothetical protein